jgi:hypothetical protein
MACQDDIRRTRRLIVLAMLAALITAIMFSGPAAAGPTQRHTHAAAGTTAAKPAKKTHKPLLPTDLPISIDLLGIKISLDVPLTLNGLLHPTTSTSSSSSPPPHTSTSTTSQHTTPPTTRTSSPSRSRTKAPSTQALLPTGTNSSTSEANAPPPTQRPTKKPGSKPGVVAEAGALLKLLLPTTLTRLMFLAVFVAGVGIAVAVVRMGRREGRHVV